MTQRKWMPAEYMDEVVPLSRATPSDWIVSTKDGYALANGDPYGDDDEPGDALQEGQTTNFHWTEHYARAGLTFHYSEDGGWTGTLDRPEPQVSAGGDMNVAEVGVWETMMPTLAEFIAEYGDKEDGATITVLFYGWSIQSTPFVFQSGAFVPVDAAAAAPH